MRTLIELYDDRPLENVISTQVFKPECTVYICSKEEAEDRSISGTIERYFARVNVSTEVVMLPADRFSAEAILEKLTYAADNYPECVLDITGGTDQALFASGMLFERKHIPAFTWSRRNNTFYSIYGAPFGSELNNTLSLSIEDFFVMAGGSVRMGRVDNAILGKYMHFYKPFFDVHLRFKKEWTSIIGWMQRASAPVNGEILIDVDSSRRVRGERGDIEIDVQALEALGAMGFIKQLIVSEDRVSFRFRDMQVRTWLRDIGSVLETYVYKACVDTGLFTDVASSVVVDWESGVQANAVSNEIDVMAARGVMPVFISCKTCDIKTEALNELSVLSERFGGEMAKAAIVSASRVQAVTRRRAHELGIEVIDLEDLRTGRLQERIASLIR